MLWHGILWIMGLYPTPSGTPWTYQFWSGIAPGIAIVTVPFSLYRRHNCVVKGCWRIGKFKQGPYLVCNKHHPGVPTRVTHDHVVRDYNEMDKTSSQ